MSVPDAQLQRAVNAARDLQLQGYFEKVRQGDQRAASLFVRLLAFTLNPLGVTSDFGCLSKTPGETHVDGFAEDAICYTGDPSDRQNVVDMVNGAGAPNASIGGGVKERRENNKWVKPAALSPEQLSYLNAGGAPVPVPPVQQPVPVVPGRDEALDELNALDAYYKAADGLQRSNGLSLNGAPDFLGIAAWYLDVYQQARVRGKTRAEARAAYVSDIRHSDEWKQKHQGETP